MVIRKSANFQYELLRAGGGGGGGGGWRRLKCLHSPLLAVMKVHSLPLHNKLCIVISGKYLTAN